MEGVIPLCRSFDTVGPIVKTVDDAVLLLSVLTGNKPVHLKSKPFEGGQLAILKGTALNDLQKRPALAFEESLKALSKFGFKMEEIAVAELDSALALSSLVPTEAYAEWRDEIEASPDVMYEKILQRFLCGREILASDYLTATRDLQVFKRMYVNKFSEFNAVILLTYPILPPIFERLKSDNGYYVNNTLYLKKYSNCKCIKYLCSYSSH